ncbi:MAG: hypothetical protein UHD64_11455 [Bacteroidales bacterium]|nr:hypothetical protein [Bacteroidales bacterium]
MKIENEVYVLAKEFDNETVYLTEEYGFDNDIRCALRAGNKITASYIIEKVENDVKMPLDLKAMPLKITYEW